MRLQKWSQHKGTMFAVACARCGRCTRGSDREGEARWQRTASQSRCRGVTIVTEIYDCRAAPQALRRAVRNGQTWIEAMMTSLARLEALCTGSPLTGR
jgi:hypothetical protein